MRPADPFGGAAFEEPRIGLAPHRIRRGPPQRVIGRQAAQIGEAKQRGDIGVVHKQVVTVTIGFIGQHLPPIGQLHHAVGEHRLFHLAGERTGFVGQGVILQHHAGHGRQLAQSRHRKQVAGNVAGEGAGIVRGAEG